MKAQRVMDEQTRKSLLECEIDMMYDILRDVDISKEDRDNVDDTIIRLEQRYRALTGNYYFPRVLV